MSSFTLDGVAEADLKRFAACFLKSDIGNTNWEEAMKLYDPNGTTKVASFRTVTNRAIQKVTGEKATKAAATNSHAATADKPAKKLTAGGKRKKTDNEDGDSEPKPKKGRTAATKKGQEAASEEKVVEDDEPGMKDEGEESS